MSEVKYTGDKTDVTALVKYAQDIGTQNERLYARIAQLVENNDCITELKAEIERLRAALKRIANDDVDDDFRNDLSTLRSIAWAALTDSKENAG